MGSEDTEKLNVDVAVDQGDARGDPRRLSFCAVGSQAPGTGLGLSGWEELQDVKRKREDNWSLQRLCSARLRLWPNDLQAPQLLHFCLHSPSKLLSVSPPLTLGKLPKSAQCGSGIHTGLLECVSLLNQECSTINVLTLCPRDGTVLGEGVPAPGRSTQVAVLSPALQPQSPLTAWDLSIEMSP